MTPLRTACFNSLRAAQQQHNKYTSNRRKCSTNMGCAWGLLSLHNKVPCRTVLYKAPKGASCWATSVCGDFRCLKEAKAFIRGALYRVTSCINITLFNIINRFVRCHFDDSIHSFILCLFSASMFSISVKSHLITIILHTSNTTDATYRSSIQLVILTIQSLIGRSHVIKNSQ